MSLTNDQVQHLYCEIKPFAIGAVCSGVTVLSPRSFVLSLKNNQLLQHVLLSFQEPFLRFHFCKDPAENKQKNAFIQLVSEKIIGKQIVDCALLNHDRILSLSFLGQGGYRLVAEFLPKRPNWYLLDANSTILASLNPVEATIYTLPEKPLSWHVEKPVVHTDKDINSSFVAKYYEKLEDEYNFLKQKKLAVRELEKEVKKAKKRLEDRLQILNNCNDWQKINHQGQLLQSNLFRIIKGMREVAVADWEQGGIEKIIALDPLVSPKDQVAAYFRRSKKLKAGVIHAERLLKASENDLELRVQQKVILEAISDPKALTDYFKTYHIKSKALPKAPVRKKIEAAKPYQEYVSQSGVKIWVGKSAKNNDNLTFHCAKGLDWWMHARNCPGSHVVIRCGKGQEIDNETLQDAGELALRFSKGRGNADGEVCLIQVKGVSRVKGTPGKVMLSKHKILHIVLDNTRWFKLKGIGGF